MGLPRATPFRFGQGHFEAVFNFYFNSRRDQKRARQIHALERVAILFLGLRHDARNAPSCFKSLPETIKPQKAGKMAQTSTCSTGEDRLWESKFHIPFQPQKWASNKSNSSVTSSCASCDFLRNRLESQSWNSFNPFPIVNRVSAGVPTPPDSGKTPQLKISKLAQNCGKTEILHLQPSYGICWSHEIETLPPM